MAEIHPFYFTVYTTELADKIEQTEETLLVMQSAEEMVLSRERGATRYLARLFGKGSLKSKINYLNERIFPAGSVLYCGETAAGELNLSRRTGLYATRFFQLFSRYGKTVLAGCLGSKNTRAAMASQNERNKLRDWLAGKIN